MLKALPKEDRILVEEAWGEVCHSVLQALGDQGRRARCIWHGPEEMKREALEGFVIPRLKLLEQAGQGGGVSLSDPYAGVSDSGEEAVDRDLPERPIVSVIRRRLDGWPEMVETILPGETPIPFFAVGPSGLHYRVLE